MITKYQFSQILNFFLDKENMARELSCVFDKYNYQTDWISGEFFADDNAMEWILVLLEDIFKDESHWVRYWMYDLDFGRRYEPGTVISSDGKNIELYSVTDLWNLLMENLNDNN